MARSRPGNKNRLLKSESYRCGIRVLPLWAASNVHVVKSIFATCLANVFINLTIIYYVHMCVCMYAHMRALADNVTLSEHDPLRQITLNLSHLMNKIVSNRPVFTGEVHETKHSTKLFYLESVSRVIAPYIWPWSSSSFRTLTYLLHVNNRS